MRADDLIRARDSTVRNPRITVVSTFTTDRFTGADGSVTERPGGPAHYIGSALRLLGCEFSVVTGEHPLVEVITRPDGEQYRIPALPTITLPPILDGDAVILSPVMREIDPLSVGAVAGMVAVDLQGFVRIPGVPSGDEPGQIHLLPLVRKANLVKAAVSELARLDDESLEALDDTILVITRGMRGADVRVRGDTAVIAARPVHARDTVGAGDCFLAAMVYRLVRGDDPLSSARCAARFTENILSERQ